MKLPDGKVFEVRGSHSSQKDAMNGAQRSRYGPRRAAFLQDEGGQVLPVVAFMMIMVLGICGLVLDVGHLYMCHRELQASADAAALAGATAMAGATSAPLATTVTGVQAIAANYSSIPGSRNVYNNLPSVTMMTGYPQLACLTTFQTQGISCVGYVPYNAVRVKLQAVIPLKFAALFGFPTMTISAGATAVKGGGPSRPYNIVIMLDTTLSMNFYDSDCGATQMQCSLAGVRVLLQHLDPCGTSQPTCTVTAGNAANSVARVSVFTFPQMLYPTVPYNYDCSNSTATGTPYTFPSPVATSYNPGTSNNSTTYRVLDFMSDYRASDTATSLYPSSLMTVAAGGSNGCAGMGAPYNAGIFGTYYAATIYSAQAALIQAQTANPGSQNVLIILGDGDANAPHTNGQYTVMGGARNCEWRVSLVAGRVRAGDHGGELCQYAGHDRLHGGVWVAFQRWVHYRYRFRNLSERAALQRDGIDGDALLGFLFRLQADGGPDELRRGAGRGGAERHLSADCRRPDGGTAGNGWSDIVASRKSMRIPLIAKTG